MNIIHNNTASHPVGSTGLNGWEVTNLKGYPVDTLTVGIQSPSPTSGCEWRICDIMSLWTLSSWIQRCMYTNNEVQLCFTFCSVNLSSSTSVDTSQSRDVRQTSYAVC